ncbi:MAG TPA: TlpA disulfide reductase family protein [Chloroflexota bacterium]|nr:TlpA disulfide reductase family protein [Chloroflexota bacterium]
MPTLEPGMTAPNFTLADLSGQPHTLSEALRQGPVLLVIWKTSCRTSKTTFPYLQRLRQAYPQAGWHLWAIGQDPEEAIKTFLGQVGTATFPVLNDYPDYVVSKLYDPVATPTLFFVDPDDTIALTAMGFSKEALNGLSDRLAARFGVAPVVVAPADDGTPPFKPG